MTNSSKPIICAVALLLLCLMVFGNTLSHEFVFDDLNTIVENRHISNFTGNLPHFFSKAYFEISGGEASYRPLPTLSYYLINQVFGTDPIGYHLFSVMLHAFNAILLLMLIRSLQSRLWVALSAAALFAVHPVVTEAVNCVSFNEDLLATCFFLTALLAAIWSERPDGSLRQWLEWMSWLAFVFALFSKEMALTLPVVIYLQDVIFKALPDNRGFSATLFRAFQKRLRLYLGYFVLMAGYLYVRFYLMAGPAVIATDGAPLMKRLVFAPLQVIEFLKLALFPFGLSAEYLHAYPVHFWNPLNLVSFFIVSGMIVVAWLSRKKTAVFAFGIGWFIVTLTPVLNIYELINPLAERYLYLPVIGIVMAAVAALSAVLSENHQTRPKWIRYLVPAVLIGLVIVYGAYSVKRNRIWQDNFTLFSETAKKVPDSPRVRGGLGLAYQQMNRLNDAIREFQRAIELNPGLVNAHFSLAYAYEQSGRTDEAIAAYERAASLDSGFRDVQYNLAGLYVKRGRLEDALTAYNRHLENSPGDIEARNNLGVVYAMLGRLADAEDQWRRVLAVAPDNQKAYANIEKLNALKSGGGSN